MNRAWEVVSERYLVEEGWVALEVKSSLVDGLERHRGHVHA